jgi:putative membrane protein
MAVQLRSASAIELDMTDLLLAIAHHLLVFSLVGILAAELALCRPGLSGAALTRLAKVDGSYGIVASLIIVVGICRVIFGMKGAQYYLHNPWFWGKMLAIVIVALLSIFPTIAILRWRKAAGTEPGFVPSDRSVAGVRQYFIAELLFLAVVIICAATMARSNHF